MRTLLLAIGLILLSSNVNAQFIYSKANVVKRFDKTQYYSWGYYGRLTLQKEDTSGAAIMMTLYDGTNVRQQRHTIKVRFTFKDGTEVITSAQYNNIFSLTPSGSYSDVCTIELSGELLDLLATKKVYTIMTENKGGVLMQHANKFKKVINQLIEL